jgi:YHS domain-containing protein
MRIERVGPNHPQNPQEFVVMNSRFIAGFVASVLVFTCSAVVVSAAVKEPKDAKCPVSGHDCDPSASADLDGGKVYFCCEKCVAAFEGESAKFTAKAHQQMVSTGQLVQKGCPFSGGPVKPGTQISIGDAEVGFCCPNCKGKVEKAGPDDQVTMVFGRIDKGFKPAAK